MDEHLKYDEKQLLQQMQLGNELAFEKIYKQYSTKLYGNLFKFVKSDKDAQELLQDVFLKVWKNRQQIDMEKPFSCYILKIAENNVYDFFRQAARDKKRAAHLITISPAEYLHIEEMLSNKETALLLENAIKSLSPQRQQIFRLCKIEDKSYKEVSELLGISVSTISDHIVKATKAIRTFFIKHEHALLSLLALSFCMGS
jgi:RNA polymerase sigma-70 factor (family 1)